MSFLGKVSLLLGLCTAGTLLQAASRPSFDKTDHVKTCWIHANSWFAPDKDRLNPPLGGPDVAFKLYPRGRVWLETAQQLARYGVNGIQYEIGIWNPKRVEGFSAILDEFAASGTDVQGVYFIPIHMPKFHENMVRFIELSQPEFSHPRYHRVDGRPVIVLYRYWTQKPEAIEAMISEVESRFGKFIWLGETMLADDDVLRKYLPVLDGITMYGNWTVTSQQEFFRRLVPIMKNEFPEKIFEAGVQNLNCDHFHVGGVAPRNLDKFLDSWKTSLEAQPDSISLTNLFDHSENSHMLPSWAWENVLMRINQYNLNQWRGKPMEKTPVNLRPDIFVVNSANVIIGQDAHFDLVTFPSAAMPSDTFDFAIVNARGEVLKDFGKITMATNRMDIRRFDVNTAEFADEYVIYPKIRWQVMGKGTNLVPSFQPWKLTFASCTENALKTQEGKVPGIPANSWMMNDARPGDTLIYPADGRVCITGNIVPMFGGAYNHNNNNRARILRNGKEFISFSAQMFNFSQLFYIPNPHGAYDLYHIELENQEGYRFISMPIKVVSNERTGKITMPIPQQDRSIKSYTLDAVRVPFFYYPCNSDDIRLVRDASGFEHDGFVAGASFQGGHLPMVGYRYEHTGIASNMRASDPLFLRDEDGQGFYRFNGKGYIKFMGNTMPAYASTIEFSIRVSNIQPGGILGTGNNQLNVEILPDGRLQALRGVEKEGMGGAKVQKGDAAKLVSAKPIELNKWTRIAIVYDCQEMSLYVDGILQGRTPFSPTVGHEWFNSIVIGGKGRFPFADVYENFSGDIRQIRFYGRNLSPREFLK